ncbi:hypothetical protein [Actinomadura geliboluensis]|uniref:Uncharacterized protein n=1 Tax=Actinomadura geliboluensis TaxID=882440 RepID=A0A5S4GWC7_9ACTN|nr:hypothetical protein [Actinomadura geliboluensis]TMR37258.1 hypothetical protein ETD96_18895 [Actinomadura geliboluensis]
MAKLTEEERERRALMRARREALAAEQEDRRREERRQKWVRDGAYLSREEFEAGEPCRGCGEPLLDQRGDRLALAQMTPEQREEHDREEARYLERHSECRSHRWSIQGSRTLHCGYCCPPHPLSHRQIEHISRIFASVKSEVRKRDLDDWDLTLTCDHMVRVTQHRDHDYYSRRVVDCPTCSARRGVVQAHRIGPTDDAEGRVRTARLVEELQAAEAKLERQNKAITKTQRRIEELGAQLRAPGSAADE